MAARVVATVMLLQAFEGLSDREACDRLEVDLRWQAAASLADLLTDARYVWHGSRNFVQLDPSILPAHIFRVHPIG